MAISGSNGEIGRPLRDRPPCSGPLEKLGPQTSMEHVSPLGVWRWEQEHTGSHLRSIG
jgi:hypothetical protein